MVKDTPEINKDHDSDLSRRDFLKVAGVGVGALFIGPKVIKEVTETGATLEKEAVLLGVRKFLIRNEDIPPEIKDVPIANEHFMFADELLKRSLSRYEEWRLKESLPSPFFRKSESYFDSSDLAFGAVSRLPKFYDFMKEFIIDKEGHWVPYKESEGNIASLKMALGYFEQDLRGFIYSEKEKFGSRPITFSREDLGSSYDLLYKNPGSSLVKRACDALKVTNDYQTDCLSNEEVDQALHQEIDPIWSWVDNYVRKVGSPMPDDIFLAGLIYLNKGDITGSLWDKVVLKKLASRNDPLSYHFNGAFIGRTSADDLAFLESVRRNTDLFLGRIQDFYSPRLSANWVAINSRNLELFAFFVNDHEAWQELASPFPPSGYKPFDPYCAAGLYHQDNIMALATVTDPKIVQAMILDEDFYLNTGLSDLGPNPDYGLEKVAADLLVGYRLPEVRKILDKYSK